jgi:iron complex transport system permease protein
VSEAAHVVRLAGERVSFRFHLRPLLVALVLVAVTLVGAIFMIGTGDYPLSPGQVIETLLGGGDSSTSFIGETLRLPRVLTAVLVGAALGVAGAIFQSIARNPLGSPDVIGFTYGAATGALVVILVWDGSSRDIAFGAIAGGLITAVAVYLLSVRGGVQGYRLVLVGIGIGAMALAANNYMLTRARRDDAYEAARWLIGSLNNAAWDQVIPIAIALAVLLPVALALGRRLQMLEMGDDAAQALGVNVGRSRLALSGAGVALTAVGVASTGLIAFVALAAPQLARRLTRTPSPGLLTSALMGSAVLVLSDLVGQRLTPKDMPVGVITGLIGGAYLAWLLSREWRSR